MDISEIVKLSTVIGSLALAYIQWQKAKTEERAYRQQLISLLHHAEGISDSLHSLSMDAERFSSTKDIALAAKSVERDAKALFLGLVETKVGGVTIKNDLDKKYSELVDLELELKKLPSKHFLESKELEHKKEISKQ